MALAAALLLFPRGDDGLLGLPELEVGDIAPRTVKSPRSFSAPDPVATAESRARARASVPEVYDHLLDLGDVTSADLGRALATKPEPAKAAARRLGLDDPEPLRRVARDPRLTEAARAALGALFEARIVPDAARIRAKDGLLVREIDAEGRVTREQVLEGAELEDLVHVAELPGRAARLAEAFAAERSEADRAALAAVIAAVARPNFLPNPQETRRRRRWAEDAVKPSMVMVARGDRILRADERVTLRDRILLERLRELESPQARIRTLVGSGLLGLVLAWLGFRVARHGYRLRAPLFRDQVFLASAFLGFLALTFVGFKMVEWLVEVRGIAGLTAEAWRGLLPLAAVPIVARTVAGPMVAVAGVPVLSALAGFMMDESLAYATYTAVGGLAAASAEPHARLVFGAGLRAGLAQAAVALAVALVRGPLSAHTAGLLVLIALGSGLIAAVLARISLPAMEALFGYTTPTGLAAFADPEHPLLRELLVEVPGTYHRGQQVGALAEAGAKALGSDRLLARVAGYLHDVGRLGGAATPPERRARAARMGGEQRFPPALAAILAEQPLGEPPTEKTALPRSKTSALVFLAHRVEAALAGREGTFADETELGNRIRNEVRSALGLGYLDRAALELRELTAIERAFIDALGPRFLAAQDLSWATSRGEAPPS